MIFMDHALQTNSLLLSRCQARFYIVLKISPLIFAVLRHHIQPARWGISCALTHPGADFLSYPSDHLIQFYTVNGLVAVQGQ